MASSIVAGLNAISEDATATLVMPADMPDLTAADINALLAAHLKDPTRILRATDNDGTPGSPAIFPRRFFNDLLALKGDESGRSVLKTYPEQVDYVALPASHATLDLDTAEAWAAWRAR